MFVLLSLFLPLIIQTVKSEDPQSMPVIVSGSTHSLGSISSPSDTASLHPHSSGKELQAADAELSNIPHKDDSNFTIHHVTICWIFRIC